MQLKVGVASAFLQLVDTTFAASSTSSSSSSAPKLITDDIRKIPEKDARKIVIDGSKVSVLTDEEETDEDDEDDDDFLTGRRRALQFDQHQGIEQAHIYGNIYGLQYYFIDLMVGVPNPQRVSVIADTGSDLCGFPCEPYCTSCGKHIDTQFDMKKSASAKLMTCDECSYLSCGSNNRCTYSMSYSEGSSISGLWFKDKISFGDVVDGNPILADVMLGCHTVETNLFVSQKANGIIGLGPGRGKKTVIEDLYEDKAHINHRLFTMCLNIDGGMLSVGGTNTTLHDKSQVYPWFYMNPSSFYYVDMTGIFTVGTNDDDKSIDTSSFSSVIVDSGTTFTYFPRNAFFAMWGAIKESCEKTADCKVDKDDDDNKCVTKREGLPTFRFKFKKKTSDLYGNVDWLPKHYTYTRGTNFCFAADKQSYWSSDVILGASFMLGKDIIFDLEKERIKFVLAECPTFKARVIEEPAGSKPEVAAESTTKDSSTVLVFYAFMLIVIFLGGISVGFSFYRRRRQFYVIRDTDEIGVVPGEHEDPITFGDPRLFEISGEDEELEL